MTDKGGKNSRFCPRYEGI